MIAWRPLLIALMSLYVGQAWGQDNSDDPIIRYEIVDDYEEGESEEFEPPIQSINYILETAVPLNKGEFFYQNILLFGQRFGYGVSDRFTLNGGIELFNLVNGNQSPTIYLGPKLNLNDRYDPIKVAVGTNFFYRSDFGFAEYGGNIYGVITIGDLDNNLTAGIHFGYDRFEFFGSPLIQISGKVRLSDHWGLVLESVNLTDTNDFVAVPALFIRFMSPSLVVDLGAATTSVGGGVVPLANFAIQLNKR